MDRQDFLVDKSDDALLEELRRVARSLGKRSVTKSEFATHGRAHPCTLQKRFGGWNKALEKAGLEITKRNNIPDDTLLEELRRVARSLGKQSVTRSDFDKYGRVHHATVRKRFGGWNKALEKAGLRVTKRNKIPNKEIFDEIAKVWNLLGRKPSQDEFSRLSKFSSSLLKHRFGTFLKAMEAYLEEHHTDDSLGAEHDNGGLKLVIHAPSAPGGRAKRTKYGSLINFRGMQHAPLNELGVVFLFGMLAKELGFVVEAISADFPDCEAKRHDPLSETWERVLVEFEFNSLRFKEHGHDPKQCDLIVCWKHDWDESPIEVLELSRLVANSEK